MTEQITDWTQRLARLRAEPSTDEPRDEARLARVGRTRTEMLAQGTAIAETLAGAGPDFERVRLALHRRPDRVVVVGCGDSWFVGMAAAPILERALGIPCFAVEAFEHAAFAGAAINRGALVIGLTSGGNTPAVINALARAKAEGAIAVGMSNTPGSPAMTGFDAGLLVHASRKGWPTQSSMASIALLAALASHLAAESAPDTDSWATDDLPTALDSLPACIDALIARIDGPVARIAAAFADAPMTIFTGAGPDFAAASFGAAKLRELTPTHAFALPLEEMHHYRLPKRGDRLVIVATAPEARERALDTALVARAEGARSFAVLRALDAEIIARVDHHVVVPEAAGPLAAIMATVPLHALAYHAAIARAELGLGGPWS
jgi:glucosamine--fructose-6-phosphate aminotransferase (isomerizing)